MSELHWVITNGKFTSDPLTTKQVNQLCKIGRVARTDHIREDPGGRWMLVTESPFRSLVAAPARARKPRKPVHPAVWTALFLVVVAPAAVIAMAVLGAFGSRKLNADVQEKPRDHAPRPSGGISTYRACSIMDGDPRFRVGLWKERESSHYGHWWSCLSPYVEIGRNNLAYYAEGDQRTAKQLRLVLNVNDESHGSRAGTAFGVSAVRIANELGGSIPKSALEDLSDGLEPSWVSGGARYRITREDYETGAYKLTLFVTF